VRNFLLCDDARMATLSSPSVIAGSEPKAHSALRVIATVALVAGTADITAACIHAAFFGATPVRVFQSVASGLLGPKSFEAGAATAALGLFLHYVIMTCWATAFYIASRKLKFLVERWYVWGPVYGIFVHLFMQFVTIPLSAIRPRPFNLQNFLIGMGIHIVCVGIAIAYTTRRHSR
jgi:hypothetical protein